MKLFLSIRIFCTLIMCHLFFSYFALAQPECNGDAKLCDRRFDQVVYPTTHNSTSVTREWQHTFFIPNQEKGVETQLKEGIRAFMLDAWYYNGIAQRRHRGEVWACHQLCALGGQPMVNVLKKFKTFLDENPNEVITFIFESYVSSADMTELFIESGLLQYVSPPPVGAWPTLGEMIKNNQRLVVLTDNADHGPDWYIPMWDYAVETPYTYKNVNQFTCNFNRGKAENSLFILNHFLTKALFRRAFNRKADRYKSIMNRAHQCFAEKGKIPNFLTVDFYRQSKVVEIAKILNHEFLDIGR